MSNFIKNRLVEAEVFQADRWKDGRTDMKLTVAFLSSANAPKKGV